MSIVRRLRLYALACLVVPAACSAALVEEVIEVPVHVRTLYGREIDHAIKVTVFRDDQRARAPWLVLNHGRPATAAGFARMKRQRYAEVSRWFVEQGFVVFVPTRVGYGETGGIDVEDSGRCEFRQFAPAYLAAAEQTAAVLKTAATLSWVDLSRGLVVGQSFGGMTAITLSTMDLPGLRGAINFAGGGGGNPTDRPANPCSADRLETLYRDYGSATKVPTLWLYSENDRYWGQEWPKRWFAAFGAAGGKGRFVTLPPYKDDGHAIFSGDPDAWKPEVARFLDELGFGRP